MASYRFCRSDDVALLVRAHEACFRPHFPGLEPLTVDGFKRAAREIDLWTSSCMVAAADGEPIAVLLAAKRDHATWIWRVGVRPGYERQGHGKHLMDSLSAKLAILGPPALLAEVPEELRGGLAFFEACGWRREVDYTDWVCRRPLAAEPPPEWVVSPGIEDLVSCGLLDGATHRAWARCDASLVRRADLAATAVASAERIEAFVVHDERPGDDERHVLALGCPEPARREVWFGLLLRSLAGRDPRPLRLPRAAPGEVPESVLRSCGFEPDRRTRGLAAEPRAA